MKLNAYAVYDTATAAYTRPLFFQADGQAIRWFKDESNDADGQIGSHPEDYSFHRVGNYNDQTGLLEAETKECLGTALEMVAASRNVDGAQLKLLDDAIKEQA